jgi:hypothetical protein
MLRGTSLLAATTAPLRPPLGLLASACPPKEKENSSTTTTTSKREAYFILLFPSLPFHFHSLNATLSSLVLEPPDCRRLERSEDEEKELADIVVWMAL